jgi:hypothetical protein
MQVVTVFFASFIAGSLLNQLALLLTNPQQVLSILGTGGQQGSMSSAARSVVECGRLSFKSRVFLVCSAGLADVGSQAAGSRPDRLAPGVALLSVIYCPRPSCPITAGVPQTANFFMAYILVTVGALGAAQPHGRWWWASAAPREFVVLIQGCTAWQVSKLQQREPVQVGADE